MKKIKVMVGLMAVAVFFTSCSKDSRNSVLYQEISKELLSVTSSYMSADSADFLSQDITIVKADTKEDSNITADAAFIFNDTKREVVLAKNVYERVYPASTTKLLTALVALKYGNLSDVITVQSDDGGITVPGARLCHLKEGDRLTLRDLLQCLLVYSGNDAAVTIGQHIFGSEEAFVEKMNEEAALIGATNTHFVNSYGLHDNNHYTTAYDMYLILRQCLLYPEFVTIASQKECKVEIVNKAGETKSVVYKSTNLFLIGEKKTPKGVTIKGGKTGSTYLAGECIVLNTTNAQGDDCITAVFNARGKDSLYKQLEYLLTLN